MLASCSRYTAMFPYYSVCSPSAFLFYRINMYWVLYVRVCWAVCACYEQACILHVCISDQVYCWWILNPDCCGADTTLGLQVSYCCCVCVGVHAFVSVWVVYESLGGCSYCSSRIILCRPIWLHGVIGMASIRGFTLKGVSPQWGVLCWPVCEHHHNHMSNVGHGGLCCDHWCWK